MKFIDSEGGSINYASSDKNTKIIFEVPDGFIISQLYDNTYNILPVTDEDTRENSNIEIPDQPVEIIGEWELLSYRDVNNITFAIKDVKTFIQFDMSSKFTGNVGCNSFSGTFVNYCIY